MCSRGPWSARALARTRVPPPPPPPRPRGPPHAPNPSVTQKYLQKRMALQLLVEYPTPFKILDFNPKRMLAKKSKVREKPLELFRTNILAIFQPPTFPAAGGGGGAGPLLRARRPGTTDKRALHLRGRTNVE